MANALETIDGRTLDAISTMSRINIKKNQAIRQLLRTPKDRNLTLIRVL